MKKLITMLTLFCLVLTVAVANVSSNPESFVGQWDLMIEGTPQGDIRVIMTLEKVDGVLVGNFKMAGTDQETKLSSISGSSESISFSFFAEGYDLYMNLKPDGENAVKGFLIDQFPVSGKRLK
jgi:hypothetical protein